MLDVILRITLPYMCGAGVRRVQEMLDLLSFDGFGKTDGVYGPKTERAVRRFQEMHRLKVDGIVGPRTMSMLKARVESLESEDVVFERADTGPTIIDITETHPPPRNATKWRRKASDITSIVLHQTGCEMPQSPLGWARVNAHYGITLEGVPVRLNPISMMIWHAQRLSGRSVGIEIEGNYPGVQDEPLSLWTPGGGPHVLNERMITAARVILDDILQQTAIHHVYAHRQSSKNRRACPGEAIWRQIAIPMRKRLGCNPHDLSQRFGDEAREIPNEWDPQAVREY
jgi:peptidoglycan hydrolase-like protein with peptidoglycan-binding domain